MNATIWTTVESVKLRTKPGTGILVNASVAAERMDIAPLVLPNSHFENNKENYLNYA